MPETSPASPFVPDDFDPADLDQIRTLFTALRDRPLHGAADVQRWVDDASDLCAALYEHGSRCNIANACDTEDPAKEAALMQWLSEIQPTIKPLMFALQQKYLTTPAAADLDELGLRLMRRHWRAEVELFREQNVALQTRDAELAKDYGKLCGAMSVEFDGRTQTLQQLARYQEEPDRAVRREAWVRGSERRLADRATIDALFDEQLQLRRQIAHNADHNDYRSYLWCDKHRDDYTVDDCLAFGDAVAATCVPVVRRLDAARRAALGVDRLRPWDTAVDVKGRPPLRPFDADDIDDFIARTLNVLRRIDAQFAERFATLREHGELDLASRLGKRPGGFQASLERRRRPFIFMNAAGVQRDVETLIHEAGHALHYLDARHIDNLFLRHAPLEFCEVASMSMELLALDAMDAFYPDDEQRARAKRVQLESIVRVLCWVATIDGFQHWLYTHAGHGKAERTKAWVGLLDRFAGDVVDWTDHPDARRALWQKQMHLFHVPFYYIEYGIAQLGALGVWLNYRRDAKQALGQLRAAFALGGSRPLPELFETAGLRFDFSEATLRPLIAMLERELASVAP